VHKTANVLNKLPNSLHPKAKHALHDIWMAETRKDAEAALDVFIDTAASTRKRPSALPRIVTRCLPSMIFPPNIGNICGPQTQSRSAFATVRHRTTRSKGCLSNKTALAMIFKLAQAAEKSWRRLKGYSLLPKVILGVKFNDGIEIVKSQSQTAA
jgi:putative transposase